MPGPVQRVAGFELLAGIELEPALTALLFRPAIPGDAKRLQPPAWKRDEVLLQRIDPEGVGDRIVVERNVRAIRADHEPVAIAKERGRDPEMLERGVGEVAEYRCRRGRLHCERVVRALPGIKLRRVTAGAGVGADVFYRLLSRRMWRGAEQVHDGYRAGSHRADHS